jgi:hypothetical protein
MQQSMVIRRPLHKTINSIQCLWGRTRSENVGRRDCHRTAARRPGLQTPACPALTSRSRRPCPAGPARSPEDPARNPGRNPGGAAHSLPRNGPPRSRPGDVLRSPEGPARSALVPHYNHLLRSPVICITTPLPPWQLRAASFLH